MSMAPSLGVSCVDLAFTGGVGDAVPFTAVNDGPVSGKRSELEARKASAKWFEASAAMLGVDGKRRLALGLCSEMTRSGQAKADEANYQLSRREYEDIEGRSALLASHLPLNSMVTQGERRSMWLAVPTNQLPQPILQRRRGPTSEL